MGYVLLFLVSFQIFSHVLCTQVSDSGPLGLLFHYIINQKQEFYKTLFPSVYQEAADIRDVYLYKKFAVQVGSWYTGGTMFYRQKIKGVSAYKTQNTL